MRWEEARWRIDLFRVLDLSGVALEVPGSFLPPLLRRKYVTFQQLIRMGLDFLKTIWTIVSARRPVRITVGLILLFIGIAGLFLPVSRGQL